MLGLRASAAALGLTLATAGCHKRGADVTIGAYLSLSGQDSTFGLDARDGIELAAQELNGAGGVKGKKVRVLYEDDKSSALEAASKVRQLVDRDGVLALLGEVASSRSIVGGQIADTKHVPMLTPASTALEITEGHEYVFRSCFSNAQQGDTAARFVHDELKKTKAAVLFVADDAYSSGLAQSFRASFTRLGGQIVADKSYPAREASFKTVLQAVKAASPEIVFVPVYYADMTTIARQAKEVGIPGATLFGGDAWDSSVLLQAAGVDLEGAHFTDHYVADAPWDVSQAFARSFRARYGRDPGSVAAQGYDAAKLLFDAIGRSPELTPESIKTALLETKGFQGATGTVTMDKSHNAQKPVLIVQIKNKKLTYRAQIAED